jgi:hypothetical protein
MRKKEQIKKRKSLKYRVKENGRKTRTDIRHDS